MKLYYLFFIALFLAACSYEPQEVLVNDSQNMRNLTFDSSVYGIYPNYTLTPGDVVNVSLEELCTVGYTKKVRDVPESLKDKVYLEYGITTRQPYEYEVDHLISLELGGSNDIRNLWPEPYNISLGARKKDVVENYLKKQVCENGYDLKEAQWQIVYNWTKIYWDIKNWS